MRKVTGKEINSAYTQINELDKEGLDRDLPATVWVNSEIYEFTWDPEVGRRGAWILATKIDLEEEEFADTNEDDLEDLDDYDHYL